MAFHAFGVGEDLRFGSGFGTNMNFTGGQTGQNIQAGLKNFSLPSSILAISAARGSVLTA